MSEKTRHTKKKRNFSQKSIRLSACILSAAMMINYPVPGALAQTFSCATGIAFGSYMTCTSTGTSTITPNNTRSTSGCISAGGAPYNRALCIFTNFTASSLNFSITSTKYTITNSTGSQMTVDNFQCRFQGDAGTTTGNCTYTASPFFVTMNIGADLTVKTGQASGTYNGTFTVQTNIP